MEDLVGCALVLAVGLSLFACDASRADLAEVGEGAPEVPPVVLVDKREKPQKKQRRRAAAPTGGEMSSEIDCQVTEADWKRAAEVAMSDGPASTRPPLEGKVLTGCRAVELGGQRVPYLFQLEAKPRVAWALVDGAGDVVSERGAAAAKEWLSRQEAPGRLGAWGTLALLMYFEVLPDKFALTALFNAESQAAPEAWLRKSYHRRDRKEPVYEWEARDDKHATLTLYLNDLGGIGGGGMTAPTQLRLEVKVSKGGLEMKAGRRVRGSQPSRYEVIRLP